MSDAAAMSDTRLAETEGMQERLRWLEQQLAERQREVVALQASNEHYRLMYEVLPVMMHSIDERGNLLLVSNTWLDVLGYQRNEVIGRKATDFLTEEAQQYAHETVAPAFLATGCCKDVAYQMVKKNGDIIDVLLSAVADRDEHGAIRRSLAVISDITDRKHAEQEIRRGQVLLQGVLDNMPAAVFVKDFDGHTLLANQHLVAELGIAHSELMSKPDTVLFPPEVVAVFRAHEREVWTTGQAIELEESLVHADGVHVYRTVKFPLFNAQGEMYAVGGISTDVTMQRQAAEELQASKQALLKSQQLLRLIIDHIPLSIFWKDRNLTYLGANRYFTESAGLANPDVIIGKTDYELVWQEHADKYRADDQAVMERDEVILNYEEAIQGATRGAGWARTSKIPLHDSSGAVTAVLGIFEDITERKQAEERLQTFYALVENAPDGFSLADMQGQMLYMNPAFRAMTGYGNEAIGQSLSIHHPPEEDARTPEIVQQVMAHGTWQGLRVFRRKDGSLMDGHLSAFVVVDQTGHPLALAGIVRDITEQRQMEEERAALQQQIIVAQQAALRELNTPLIPIADKVMVMPLIGSIDSQRAQQVMETLLEGVAAQHAEIVILDITGVQVVDTQVANAFIRAAQAVKLLGAQVLLTGIQPQIAQTLVQLGVDLSGIVTQSSLQQGIALALAGRISPVRR